MLALIAGNGALPAQVAAALSVPPLVCTLKGYAPDQLTVDITFRFETLGSFLGDLAQRGVTEVCFCGSVSRPALDLHAIDAKTMPLVPMLKQALQAGDDGALRAMIDLFEGNGFAVRAAHELAPSIVAAPGVLSAKAPDRQMEQDAARGTQVLAALATLDVGQACVVGGGQVLGIESLGGTDFLMAHLPTSPLRAVAVLVKGPKLGQDRRVDMPTIGLDTVRSTLAAGLAGIVIEAGKVIVLNPDEVIRACDNAGLVLWSRSDEP
jgi:DUF1009 family protein